MLHTQAIALKGLLGKRQILTSTLDNQLRWGKNKAGLFNLKEAKLFKWLVQQSKILTWDNLRKRGFVGPSRCHLCRQHEETTNHLLNRCTFTTILWNWVGKVFEQIDKNVNDNIATLKKWRKNFSDNEIINSAWMLVPGFIIWNVWKERKDRIFKHKASPVSSILKLILRQLKETVHILGGVATDKPTGQREARILKKLELKVHPPQGPMQINKNISAEKASWQPPSHGFLKFNIDGASKGNLVEAGYGGVMRDEEGKIQIIFHSYLGKATNNMAELMQMELCLEILLKYNIHNVIIEANSELVINLVKRISVGVAPEKISRHWRLLQVYQRIQVHLRMLRTLRLVDVRREANKVADWLANEGVRNKHINLCYWWEEVMDDRMMEECSSRALSNRQQYQEKSRERILLYENDG